MTDSSLFDCYQNGFILSEIDRFTPSVRSWSTKLVGNYVLKLHPKTKVVVLGSCVLIGDFFSIEKDSVAEIVACAAKGEYARLEDLGGRWVLLVLHDYPVVLHDAFGGRSVFYKNCGSVGISSHAALLAEYFDIPTSPRHSTIIEGPGYRNRTVAYMPGDLTAYEGIFALIPNNLYSISKKKTSRYWPQSPKTNTTFPEFQKRMQQYLARMAMYLQRIEVVVGFTGGIDSRLLIAGFHSRGLDFRGVTWNGDRRCPPAEQVIVRDLVLLTGVNHRWIDARGGANRTAALNSGGVRFPQSIATMHAENLASEDYFITGHGGEVMRGFYNLRRIPPLSRVNPTEFFDCYNITAKGEPDPQFRDFGIEAFEAFIDRGNYDQSILEFGYDINDIFYWEHRMGMWSALFHSELDTASYCMPGFSDRKLFEVAYGLDSKLRLSKNLFAKIIRRYNEALGKISIV